MKEIEQKLMGKILAHKKDGRVTFFEIGRVEERSDGNLDIFPMDGNFHTTFKSKDLEELIKHSQAYIPDYEGKFYLREHLKTPRAKQRIYISGKIAGLPQKEAKFNFAMAEFSLQEDWEVVNPFDIKKLDDFAWEEYIIRDIVYLKHCDAIYMLKNWADSIGARIELLVARKLGLKVVWEGVAETQEVKESVLKAIEKIEGIRSGLLSSVSKTEDPLFPYEENLGCDTYFQCLINNLKEFVSDTATKEMEE